ncbi:MAG: hypothetical protein ACKO5Q_14245, partial [Microcystaceae cyanobacterium]
GLVGLIFGPTSGLVGLIFGLFMGISTSEIELRTLPNQGIRSSLSNGFIFGLIGGLIGWLMFGQIPILLAFLILWQMGGVGPVIRHFVLRLVLYKKGGIPWNYAKFLDFASDRLLMKKVGGGYLFFHRMLLEHFARMKQD